MDASIRNKTMVLAAALVALPAAAQQPAERQSRGLEEVTVTAQRREESLQNVPLSVSAFTVADLEERQIVDTYDVAQFVPNLHVFHNASSLGTANAYYIRGIGNPESIATTDVPVGTYIDDIYVPRQQSANINLFEVERVEVLRGPQGTLFGRNTTGGAVSIITRKPSNRFYVNGEASVGSFGRVEGRATVNLPATETLAVMLSGFGTSDEGWIRSTVTADDNYNQRKGWGGRVALRWRPGERVDWNVNVMRVNSSNWIANNPAPTTAPQPLQIGSTFSGQWRTTLNRLRTCNDGSSPRQWLANGCGWNEVSETSVTSNLQFALSGTTVNLITGYRKMDHRYSLDFQGNQPVFVSSFAITNFGQHDLFSQEVKFTGNVLGGRLGYTAGVFYMKETNDTDFQDWLAFNRGPFTLSADRLVQNDTESYAAYAQGDYDFTDRLRLTAGVRWTRENKTLDLDFFAPTRFTEANIGGDPDISASKVTPKLSLQYKFTDGIMGYVSATNGFKSGGWNGRATNPFAFRDFGPEKVWSYEVGARTDLLDRRLRVNATLFWADFKDLQINSAIPGSNPPVFIAQNSGDSRTKGVELEIVAAPTENLQIFSNLGLQDAKFTRLSAEALQAGFTLDSTVAGSPDVSWDLGLSYRREIAAIGGALLFSGAGHYAPEFRRALVPTSSDTTPELFLVSAGVTYERSNSPFSVALECNNCTDKKYFENGSAQGEPLRWMLRLRYRP